MAGSQREPVGALRQPRHLDRAHALAVAGKLLRRKSPGNWLPERGAVAADLVEAAAAAAAVFGVSVLGRAVQVLVTGSYWDAWLVISVLWR